PRQSGGFPSAQGRAEDLCEDGRERQSPRPGLLRRLRLAALFCRRGGRQSLYVAYRGDDGTRLPAAPARNLVRGGASLVARSAAAAENRKAVLSRASLASLPRGKL